MATPEDFPQVDLESATLFFERVRDAYQSGNVKEFSAARTMVLLSLGLPTSVLMQARQP